jgi:hypothetical protein
MAIKRNLAEQRDRPRSTGRGKPASASPVWQRIVKLGQTIPRAEIERWPADGAAQFDHYVDGTPKQPE